MKIQIDNLTEAQELAIKDQMVGYERDPKGRFEKAIER